MAQILAGLEADPVELQEQVLPQALLAQIDQPLEKIRTYAETLDMG